MVLTDLSNITIAPSNSTFNDFCKLKFNEGNGTESGRAIFVILPDILVERFYYDPDKKACFKFTFKGGSTNMNNFGTEQECLEQCYIDVGEAVPLNETDVVIIHSRSVDESEAPNQCNRNENQKCTG